MSIFRRWAYRVGAALVRWSLGGPANGYRFKDWADHHAADGAHIVRLVRR